MGPAAASCGLREAVADLDSLDRLNAHERRGQSSIETPIRLDVRPQPDRHIRRDDLDHAAERIAVLPSGIDLLHHGGRHHRVGAAHGVVGQSLLVLRNGAGRVVGQRHRADPYDVTDQPNARHLIEDRGRHRAEGDPGGRLTRGGALQDRPGIGEVVLERSGQIRVPGTRPGQGPVAGDLALIPGASIAKKIRRVDRIGAHDGGPLGPLGVADPQSDGATDGAPVSDAAENRETILLEGLACAPPVAESATRESPRYPARP